MSIVKDKFTFHVIGLPHTVTSKESGCYGNAYFNIV